MQQAERVATVPAPVEPVGAGAPPRCGLWSPTFALVCAVSFFCYVHWCLLGPIMPLWIGAELCLPVNLEETYLAACAARRIP